MTYGKNDGKMYKHPWDEALERHEDIADTIEEIADMAGTTDADFKVFVAAARLLKRERRAAAWGWAIRLAGGGLFSHAPGETALFASELDAQGVADSLNEPHLRGGTPVPTRVVEVDRKDWPFRSS